MEYLLMHKEIPVARLQLDDNGQIASISELYAQAHLPVGVGMIAGRADRGALNHWWTDRCIPASRSGIRHALDALQVQIPQQLLSRSLGLSLSDHYWLKPADSTLTWHQVNFFENPFSDDMGDLLFGKPPAAPFDFSTPDNTSDGNLKKRWKIMDGSRCLVKGGSGPFYQQPFNEVIASRIMARLGIPYVPYTILWDDGYPYSVCRSFVTPDTELVPAWRILQAQKKPKDVSLYRHFVCCCEQFGVEIVPFLDRMLVLDYLIANEDRHWNNFGLLRNPDTLEWLGAAPVFDSGTSLGYDKLPHHFDKQDIPCKPFKKRHAEQIRLVSNFDWLDLAALEGIGDEIRGILSDGSAGEFIDAARREAIASAVEQRIKTLQTIAQTACQRDEIAEDISENIAQTY